MTNQIYANILIVFVCIGWWSGKEECRLDQVDCVYELMKIQTVTTCFSYVFDRVTPTDNHTDWSYRMRAKEMVWNWKYSGRQKEKAASPVCSIIITFPMTIIRCGTAVYRIVYTILCIVSATNGCHSFTGFPRARERERQKWRVADQTVVRSMKFISSLDISPIFCN